MFSYLFLGAELLYNSLFNYVTTYLRNYVTKEILALKAHNFKVFTDFCMKTGTDIYLVIVNDTKS